MKGRLLVLALVLLTLLTLAGVVKGHGVAEGDAGFIESAEGVLVGPFVYLGAKHMVTGYDHLLFLVGVIFFLYRMKDVAIYVSLFTVGHSTTLLLGVLGGIQANAYLVDALIGLSVVYKGFDNLGGLQKMFGFQPDPKLAVLGFGLVHGFGLATKIQEFTLPQDGLVANILSFNLGVEIGQILALSFILVGITIWRTHRAYLAHATATNAALMVGGFLLFGYQITGYFTT